MKKLTTLVMLLFSILTISGCSPTQYIAPEMYPVKPETKAVPKCGKVRYRKGDINTTLPVKQVECIHERDRAQTYNIKVLRIANEANIKQMQPYNKEPK